MFGHILHLGVQVEYFREIWITHMKLGWSPAQYHTDKPVPLGTWKGWLLHSIQLSVDTGRSKSKRLLILAGIRIVWERDTYHQTLEWQVSLFTWPENDGTAMETLKDTEHRQGPSIQSGSGRRLWKLHLWINYVNLRTLQQRAARIVEIVVGAHAQPRGLLLTTFPSPSLFSSWLQRGDQRTL